MRTQWKTTTTTINKENTLALSGGLMSGVVDEIAAKPFAFASAKVTGAAAKIADAIKATGTQPAPSSQL